MESRSAVVGCLPHEYDGTFRDAGSIVIFMNPLKALMVAEALIRGACGLLMLNHVRFFCYCKVLTWCSIVPKMRAGRLQYNGGKQRLVFTPEALANSCSWRQGSQHQECLLVFLCT